MLKLFVQECQKNNIGYGFYYSLTNNFFLNVFGHNVHPPSTLIPNQARVTQKEYEDIAIAQMRELWTQFGELTEIWLDGGTGDIGPRVAALLNETLAFNAVAFNGGCVYWREREKEIERIEREREIESIDRERFTWCHKKEGNEKNARRTRLIDEHPFK